MHRAFTVAAMVFAVAARAPLSSTGADGGVFKWIHNLAIDAQGNLYTAEVGFGRRAQKFELVR